MCVYNLNRKRKLIEKDFRKRNLNALCIHANRNSVTRSHFLSHFPIRIASTTSNVFQFKVTILSRLSNSDDTDYDQHSTDSVRSRFIRK